MVSAIEDITRRKQDEDALARYRGHLEELVDERTRELRSAQQELIRSERLAALGQFSGNVSHEIRNPLGVIATSAFYLKRRLQGTDPKVDKHLEQISAQVDNCSRIIKSILDLTRMEAPRKQQVNLAECIRAGLSSAGAPPQNVTLALDLPAEPLVLSADPEQLRISFKNLITNAFQAMAKSGGVLSVSATNIGSGPLAQARIRIADTGPGIPAGIRDKIFQPLFTTRAQGIGFGLSITQMIIERHDGTITLAPDPGAAFVITLPISPEEVSANA
jgi:signal transduction histidine kinase